MSSIAPRTPVRGLRPHPASPGKSVFAPNLYTRGTAQNRFKSNIAALLLLLGVKIFMPQVIDVCLRVIGGFASAWSPKFAEKVVSFFEISVPLLFLWNAVEAAYHITWPATYPTSPPTPGPFSTPLSPAQRRLRGLTPKPSRPPTFPPIALPPSPLRSPTHPPVDHPAQDSFFQTSPTKSVLAVEKNPFLAPATPFRSQAGSSTNPFLNSAMRSASRDQVNMFSSSSPTTAFSGRHSVGPGKALDSSMVQSLVSELDR
ncbi:hypothetical protein RhiJN_04508 [Ceratobasidium sp. AG-Ba]|nr:hypothetical protein RhiJN_04508 [Ceratobasidium sp. AG-Ba]QRW05399.1 hypothetical protein RhiLY_04398 [Ceratobasidium sp. AG-Ba]